MQRSLPSLLSLTYFQHLLEFSSPFLLKPHSSLGFCNMFLSRCADYLPIVSQIQDTLFYSAL